LTKDTENVSYFTINLEGYIFRSLTMVRTSTTRIGSSRSIIMVSLVVVSGSVRHFEMEAKKIWLLFNQFLDL
jgi:hypothetical protein